MSRITGTVSRSVPLDAILTRSLTLQGTFDQYVSPDELVKIRPTLDQLAASGVLSAYQIYQESDSLLQGVAGVGAASPLSTAGDVVVADLLVIPITIPNVAGDNTYTYKTNVNIEIIEMVIHKNAAGAGNTIRLQDSGAANISNAVAADTADTVTRSATIDQTKKRISAGGTFKLLAHQAAGSMLADVKLYCMRY